jgi:hypothetical protein
MSGGRSPWRLAFAIVTVVALCACAGGQTGSEGYANSPGVHPPLPSVECAVDADCHTRLQNVIASWPQANGPRQLIGASCVRNPTCSGPVTTSCTCSFTRPGAATVERLQLNGECAVYGRSLSCLLPASELAMCTPGTCDCADQCSRALDLLAADDARAVQIRERVARCMTGLCKYVIDIDGHCYSGALPTAASPVLDCAQSDDALLAAGPDPTATLPAGSNTGTVGQCGAAGANATAPVADKPLAECSSQALEATP